MFHQPVRLISLLTLLLLSACSAPSAPAGPPTPAPGTPPTGPVVTPDELAALDRRAAALALRAASGDLAALRDALAEAGIAVRRLNGEVVRPAAQPALGLALAADDPEALAHLQAQGGAITLGDLAQTLQTVWPQADAVRLPALIQADLRAGVGSAVPTVRFWARFVVALGGPANDLLTSQTPQQVPLNAAQQSLLLLRLSGGLARLAQSRGVTVPTQPPALLRAQDAAPPCTFGGTEGTIMDGAASVITTGVGELLGYLDSVSAAPGESPMDTAAGLLGNANLLLSYLKFTLTFASFQLDLTTDTDTLQRTQSMVHDGDGVVTARAKVWYDLSANWQYANCFRLAFNVAGLDFSAPNAGAVEGADLRWRVFAAQGDGSYADQHTSVVAARPGEEVMHDKTDAGGVAELHFEGLRQKEDLGDAPKAVEKTGEVSVQATIKSAALAADLVDALGTGLGGLGGLVGMPAELLYRMWPISSTLPLKVRDWAPACSDVQGDTCWTGKVTVQDRRKEETVLLDPTKKPAGTDLETADAVAVYTITGGSGISEHSHNAALDAQATFKSDYAHHINYDAAYAVECANGSQRTNIQKNTSKEDSSAQVAGDDRLGLTLEPGGSYTLNLSYMYGAKTRAVPGQIRTTTYFKGGCNPYGDRNDARDVPNERTHSWGGFKVTGQASTQNGVTTLTGQQTFTLRVDGLPTTRTVTWTIHRIEAP
ncbi:hypothetical protein GO986_12495 [Deinococcus sp. HMF7620]|uniref:Uncharacterized protein n=1 Tax=Deinococcus arboris TaxID=2682977 RepID=A0A7C9IBR7_9DEIO|nr:hypothetical protein [Deinococcus arboris]MVN87586.1 hypothetical protein [Deinococcus arboris]